MSGIGRVRVAVLVDGAFFIKRHRAIYGAKTAYEVANDLKTIVRSHVRKDYLYRILYYDCWPFEGDSQNPITRKTVSFKGTQTALFRKDLFEQLKKSRKVALRLGHLESTGRWHITHDRTKELLSGKVTVAQLTPDDVKLELRQKGVDMKLGVDIASLAHKKAVDKIVLICGDSDFVPATKLARREGIDVVLDPMWNFINPALHEHIDGLRTFCPKPPPSRSKSSGAT